MTDKADLRAGDDDRAHAVARLRQGFDEGRISADEFAQRQSAAQSALTYGELDELLRDLPGGAITPTAASIASTVVPAPAPAAEPETSDHDSSSWNRNGWLSWVGVTILVNAIWLVSFVTADGDDKPGYWPIWVMVPWGAVILVGTITGRNRD